MARRRESGFDLLVKLPWPVGIVAGVLGYVVFRYGIGWYFGSSQTILRGLGSQTEAVFAPLAWVVLIACWVAAVLSFMISRKRARLLETQTGLESLKAMTWREFETLVGEAFRRQGHAVEETGGGGKDGGIDLILRKSGRMELVQCKQWKSQQVGAPVVREMGGLVAHHKADAVKIVCVGRFTSDAAAFAEGKAIELIGGERLLELVRSVQGTQPTPDPAAPVRGAAAKSMPTPDAAPSTPEKVATDPACPRCNSAMFQRFNRQTNQMFWGCIHYPRCKGTRSV
jgi:restriction system protein